MIRNTPTPKKPKKSLETLRRKPRMAEYAPPDERVSDRHKHLEFLRKTAKDALWKGDYERALTLYEDGLALARSWKDRELEDLFTCNRATTLLEMDRQDFDLSRLKEIVLRAPGSPNAVLASYAAAHAHATASSARCASRTSCRRSASSPAASHTTSTTC